MNTGKLGVVYPHNAARETLSVADWRTMNVADVSAVTWFRNYSPGSIDRNVTERKTQTQPDLLQNHMSKQQVCVIN